MYIEVAQQSKSLVWSSQMINVYRIALTVLLHWSLRFNWMLVLLVQFVSAYLCRDPYSQSSSHLWWLTNLTDDLKNTETHPLDDLSLNLKGKKILVDFLMSSLHSDHFYPFGNCRKQRKICMFLPDKIIVFVHHLEWDKEWWNNCRLNFHFVNHWCFLLRLGAWDLLLTYNLPLCLKIYFPQQKISFPKLKETYLLIFYSL